MRTSETDVRMQPIKLSIYCLWLQEVLILAGIRDASLLGHERVVVSQVIQRQPTRSTRRTQPCDVKHLHRYASMTDLTAVLPGFPTQQYVRLLPSLEKNLVTTADLLTLDCVEIAKRAQLPPLDVKSLCNAVLEALHSSLGIKELNGETLGATSLLKKTGKEVVNSWNTISTLDDELDRALGGGIPTGYITEVTGER